MGACVVTGWPSTYPYERRKRAKPYKAGGRLGSLGKKGRLLQKATDGLAAVLTRVPQLVA